MKTPLALAITAAALALSTAATAQKPQSGGTIDTIIQPEPPGLVLGMIQNAPTRTVAGNIYEPDHVNSILMAGRADLVLLARPHLADPYWTLHAAVELGDEAQAWPLPYEGGRRQAITLAERAKAMAQ